MLFLDRTHGKALGALLRRVGFKVKSIYGVYPKKKHELIPDPEWIAKCGKEGWIAVTGDKRIETNPINRHAVINAKCKMLLLTDTNTNPEEFGASIIVGRDRIQQFVTRDGPFFLNVGKQAQSHILNFRIPSLEPSSKKNGKRRGDGDEQKEPEPPAVEIRGSSVGFMEVPAVEQIPIRIIEPSSGEESS